jgi:hypothetical protein
MHAYSQWFFDTGWVVVAGVGAVLSVTSGLRAYFFVLPAVILAIMGK